MPAKDRSEDRVLLLSGGVALGAYQAGAYSHLHKEKALHPNWIAGSSIGAVNAAVIAGNPPDKRIERLQALWQYDPKQTPVQEEDRRVISRWDHLENWGSAIWARALGKAGHFRPRAPDPFRSFRSFYDLTPLRNQINALVDFDRLNGGEVRVTIALTDIMTGELVLFDTHHGDRLSVDHLLASCGYLPEFEPLVISGRLLGDGGLSANVPIEALVGHEKPITCFVVDLFAREGDAPDDLQTALARKSDLTFANQTWLRLEAFCREERLRAELEDARPNARKRASRVGAAIYYLSYRAVPAEAGSEKLFDYSKRTIARRWQSGAADMDEALRVHLAEIDTSAVRLIPIRRVVSAEAGRRR